MRSARFTRAASASGANNGNRNFSNRVCVGFRHRVCVGEVYGLSECQHEPLYKDDNIPAQPIDGVNICRFCGVLYVSRTVLDKIKEERRVSLEVICHERTG